MPMNHQDLVKKLTDPKLKANGLTKLLKDAGFPSVGPKHPVFPLGIVIDDGARVSYDVKPTELAGFLEKMGSANIKGVRSWRVFPIGIVQPETFRIEVDIAKPHGR